jgi:hypothetical protein
MSEKKTEQQAKKIIRVSSWQQFVKKNKKYAKKKEAVEIRFNC